MEELDSTPQQEPTYNDDDIKTLDWMEHIRRRPGMYIGKLGDGSYPDDGIYVLLKEVLDNSIDEYMMGYGRTIEVTIEAGTVEVRDYGRGVPLGKVVDVSSKMNTGAKYDSKAFKKSVGLNGVGIKAVNALSSDFQITSYRDGECKRVEYNRAIIKEESGIQPTDEANGTRVYFVPDNTIFKDYHYKEEYIENLLKNYVFLNSGLTINFNGKKFFSRHGLVDLLNENMTTEPLYPIIHLKGDDIELVITHSNQYGEEYYSFVNGQLTAHHTRRYASLGFQGVDRSRHQRVLQQEFRIFGYSLGHCGRHQHQGGGTRLREPDQDKTGLERYGSRRPLSTEVHKRLHQTGA